MPIYLGLDCGGSSCRGVMVDETNATLFQGQAGPANLANTPPTKLARHLERATEGAPRPDFVCGCFAGLLTEADRERALDTLRRQFPNAQLRAEPDYFAALRASDDADVCVVAGTGSVVCSLVDGQLRKSGGRGYLLGDAGSAFQYGRIALMRFLEVGPNRVSPALCETIEKRFGSLEENEILARLYRGGTPASQLAKLATVFGKDVRAGENYAIQALETQTATLFQIVLNHVSHWFPGKSEVSVCLAGGLWENGATFWSAFEAMAHRHTDVTLRLFRIARPPVHGAVQLAREMNL